MTPRTTTKDWLQRAAAAGADERGALFAEAERAAQHAGDWLSVAEAWLDASQHSFATRCLIAAEPRLEELWEHRRAASTWQRLGDGDRAIEMLTTLEARFAEQPETSGTSWRVLAEAFDELQDADGVRRCLAAGRSFAAEPDDLCAIAEGYVQLLADEATTRALLEQAEAAARTAVDSLGRADVRQCGEVARGWREWFGDDERVRDLLDTAMVRAIDVASCLSLVLGLAEWREDRFVRTAGTDACLDRARQLAATCRDWLTIAEDLCNLGYDVEDVRAAVRQAEALATPDERRAVARAMRDLGGDPEAAAAIGPMGSSPDELAAPGDSSLGWPRDAGALFDWLRERVDDAALATVAAGDYHTDEERHLAALREIRDTGLVPIPLDWHPREVVSLYQWSEGDAVDHLARAFGCTILCLAELAPEPLGGGIDDTITVLLESCCQLGTEALRRVPGLLVAIADAAPGEATPALATLALLLATARLHAADPRLETIAAHLLAVEAPLHANGYPHPEHGFVLGAAFSHLRVQVARALVVEILQPLVVPTERPSLAEVVRRLTTQG